MNEFIRIGFVDAFGRPECDKLFEYASWIVVSRGSHDPDDGTSSELKTRHRMRPSLSRVSEHLQATVIIYGEP